MSFSNKQNESQDDSVHSISSTAVSTLPISELLLKNGYYVMKDTLTYTDFVQYAKMLGSCEHFSDVKVMPSAKSYIMTSKAVPIHNDCPLIDYIGWYCKDQDDHRGDNTLVDFNRVLQTLPPAVVNKLKRIKVTYPNYQTKTTDETFVLTLNHGRPYIYYAPWLIKSDNQDWLNDTLNLLSERIQDSSFSVKLNPGQSLFVDNHRMLHGRSALQESSRRWLQRIWIKKYA